ncbi:MAG: hypothetical protein O7D86_04580 [Proteobacteria bacterium]|nr:hypothetical protein [Pseudomonadota bacterium]
MKKLILHCLIILIAGISPVLAESMKIEIIEMKNRLVSDIIPIIKPLVVEGGTVTGMNNQLIVKTTPSNLKQIKAVLAQIDYAPRRLMISVIQDIDGNFNIREGGYSGRYESGNVKFESPDIGNEGTIIQGSDSNGNVIRYRHLQTRSRIEDRNVFRIQILEGNPAYITTGQSVPVPSQTTVVTGGAVVVQDGVEYRDVTSGFYVLPRLQGDNVTLLVSPQLSRVDPHQSAVFDIQNIETTVSGRPGEWMTVGGATQHFSSDNKRNTISTKRRGQEQHTVLIKVEEIK